MLGNIVGTAVRKQGIIQDGIMFKKIYPLHNIVFYFIIFNVFVITSYLHSCCHMRFKDSVLSSIISAHTSHGCACAMFLFFFF